MEYYQYFALKYLYSAFGKPLYLQNNGYEFHDMDGKMKGNIILIQDCMASFWIEIRIIFISISIRIDKIWIIISHK